MNLIPPISARHCLMLMSAILVHDSTMATTTVPDEIMKIIRTTDYNKHHIPTKAGVIMSTAASRKTILFGDWMLTAEYRNSTDKGHIIILTQDEPSQDRTARLSIHLKIMTDILNHVDSMRRQFETYGFGRDIVTSHQQTLLRATVTTLETIKKYLLHLVLNKYGVQLQISLVKGASWEVISIPASALQRFQDTVGELVASAKAAATEEPINVTIAMYIEGMSSFRAQSMDFHVDIYFSERWTDYRLRHNSKDPALIKNIQVFEQMWHPDLYFANAKEASFHFVTAPNMLVWIWPNGTVYHDTRVSLVVNCMMDLTNYPLDTQVCSIRILSYAYDIENLIILWKNSSKEGPITLNPKIKLPDMNLVSYRAAFCDAAYEVGTWSCVEAYFTMQREIMHHILQSYIPTALIVVISWFSFWLDAESVPGRVSLCITTLLTLATQSNAARMALPQVSYAKAIDVWMGTCMAFVFGVMIEFTIVNYLSRKAKKQLLARQHGTSFNKNFTRNILGGAVGGALGGDGTIRTTMTPPTSTVPPSNGQAASTPANVNPINFMTRPNSLVRRKGTNPLVPSRNGAEFEMYQLLYSCENTDGDTPGSTSARDAQQMNMDSFAYHQQQHSRKSAARIDKICRFLFPLVFLLFNLVYWPYYLNAAAKDAKAAGHQQMEE